MAGSLFVLETAAKAVLLMWVFNGTAGSLLTVSLFHSSANTSVVFLSIMPSETRSAPMRSPSVCSASPP